ncbi:universal stress protein [Candidatus Nitrosopumilus sediminis]|uniref:UspA domain-containing protein n=1 Tax=Candidatus Nitrosopumilus sediminis TaxID=1229909 RepID=K0BBY3_9ARCH|nr:universal stress protein [Candidatus Nitrosopumilus sediminis]AFS82500.1 UspA domain-containing protein [Candidatus Nitrosopumilus sediminis]
MTSNNYKKILVPLDGSVYSEKALKRACEFVKIFDSELILIYVVEKSIPVNLLDRKEYLGMLQKFGTKILNNSKVMLSKKGITAKIILKEGNIVSEIEKVAKKEKCDLIIVGNKGLGAVTRFLLGSVSNKLSQSSPCSVMIVK